MNHFIILAKQEYVVEIPVHQALQPFGIIHIYVGIIDNAGGILPGGNIWRPNNSNSIG